MVSVGTIIGDEALMLATGLEAIIPSEGLPPNENGDSRVGWAPGPTRGHLECTPLYEWTLHKPVSPD